jgi:hypothetical protein
MSAYLVDGKIFYFKGQGRGGDACYGFTDPFRYKLKYSKEGVGES